MSGLVRMESRTAGAHLRSAVLGPRRKQPLRLRQRQPGSTAMATVPFAFAKLRVSESDGDKLPAAETLPCARCPLQLSMWVQPRCTAVEAVQHRAGGSVPVFRIIIILTAVSAAVQNSLA